MTVCKEVSGTWDTTTVCGCVYKEEEEEGEEEMRVDLSIT